MLYKQALCLYLTLSIWTAALAARTHGQALYQEPVEQTTEIARKLVLDRIDAIAQRQDCRMAFREKKIDVNVLRLIVQETHFYNVQGPEGNLKFSEVVGKPASPDSTLRDLAQHLSADAFVLGYPEGPRYIRTREVVLNSSYFERGNLEEGTWRFSTLEEKQSLLLHEVLHIALDTDDHNLNRRELCPLHLLAFCPGIPAPAALIDRRGSIIDQAGPSLFIP